MQILDSLNSDGNTFVLNSPPSRTFAKLQAPNKPTDHLTAYLRYDDFLLSSSSKFSLYVSRHPALPLSCPVLLFFFSTLLIAILPRKLALDTHVFWAQLFQPGNRGLSPFCLGRLFWPPSIFITALDGFLPGRKTLSSYSAALIQFLVYKLERQR